MANLLIRQIDEQVKQKLRLRAAERGHSMEEEAREILRRDLAGPETGADLLLSIRQRLETAGGGVDLELPKRGPARKPPAFRR